jgi:hypothetical protein
MEEPRLIVKNTTFWVVMPCNSERSQLFGNIYILLLQGPSKKLAEAGTAWRTRNPK